MNIYSCPGHKKMASPTNITQAPQKMFFRYPPDHIPADELAAEKFKQVLEAYETLSDSDKKGIYDEATRPLEEETEEENQGEQFGDNVNQGFRFSHEFKSKGGPETKCPHCSAVGVDHIVSRKGGTGSSRGKQFILSPFNIIFCRQCGHVYGVAGTSS